MLGLDKLDVEMFGLEMDLEMMDLDMMDLDTLDLEMMDLLLIPEVFLPGEGIQKEGSSDTNPPRDEGISARRCPQCHQPLHGVTSTPWEAQGSTGSPTALLGLDLKG